MKIIMKTLSSKSCIALLVIMMVAMNFESASASSIRNSNRRRAFISQECTLLLRDDIVIDKSGTENTIECLLNPNDANGIDGMILPIQTTPEQNELLLEKFASGELKSNVSTLKLNSDFTVDDDRVHVPSDLAAFEFGYDNNYDRRLRETIVTGIKPILVIKVKDSEGRARHESTRQISDDIFGSFGDQMNLKSQMKACSFGKLEITPGLPDGSDTSDESPGVIDITINVSLTVSNRSSVRNAVKRVAEITLGHELPGPYQHVMYVLENCYTDCGWGAYAFSNYWLSVYQGDNYKSVAIQMHEIGHNFGFAHSAGLDGRTYTDHTGLMGNPLYGDDIGKMCWNAAKSWTIGWYDDSKIIIDPRKGPWSGTIVGISDYDNNPSNHPILLKIETGEKRDQYVAFNRASGINAENVEADNEVTIVETGKNGEAYALSYLKDHLRQGQQYTYHNWDGNGKDLVIKADVININPANGGAGYANVKVGLQCIDSSQSFTITRPNGIIASKRCYWVKRKAVNRCSGFEEARINCPSTCSNCCQDVINPFPIPNGQLKTCEWVGVNTSNRCSIGDARLKCPVTCGSC